MCEIFLEVYVEGISVAPCTIKPVIPKHSKVTTICSVRWKKAAIENKQKHLSNIASESDWSRDARSEMSKQHHKNWIKKNTSEQKIRVISLSMDSAMRRPHSHGQNDGFCLKFQEGYQRRLTHEKGRGKRFEFEHTKKWHEKYSFSENKMSEIHSSFRI